MELAHLLQYPAPKEWQEVAEQIKIPFDPEFKYHPEYDGYIKGEYVNRFIIELFEKSKLMNKKYL